MSNPSRAITILNYLSEELPDAITNTLDFLNHFVVGFVFPIAVVVLAAVIAAAVVGKLRSTLFARYATPQQLLDNAMNQLKKYERRKGKPGLLFATNRERALDTLKYVIQSEPDMLKPHVVLATELFYGEVNDDWKRRRDHDRQRRGTSKNTDTALRRRDVQSQGSPKHGTSNLSPELIECRIRKGLRIDPKNLALLNLQNELKLVNQYGKNGAHAKMMNVGSFGFGLD